MSQGVRICPRAIFVGGREICSRALMGAKTNTTGHSLRPSLHLGSKIGPVRRPRDRGDVGEEQGSRKAEIRFALARMG